MCGEAEEDELFFEDVEVKCSDTAELAVQSRLVVTCRSQVAVDDVAMVIDNILPPTGDVTPRCSAQPIRKLTRRRRPVVRI